MKRFCAAIKKYILKDTRYFLLYCYRYFQPNYHHHCAFYTEQEFISLVHSGKSLIRMGDGEIGLLHFLPIHYQVYSDSIRDAFLTIIKNYTERSPYILMIPLFVNDTNAHLKKINRFHVWMSLKVSYEMIFKKDVRYFDQHIFYKNNKFRDLILPYLATKKIIVVSNEKNIREMRINKFNESVFAYIPCPNENTYEARDMLQQAIVKTIAHDGSSKKDFVVLLAAGLSKTIIYNMSQDGYQLLDIGKGLEGFYKGISLEYAI